MQRGSMLLPMAMTVQQRETIPLLWAIPLRQQVIGKQQHWEMKVKLPAVLQQPLEAPAMLMENHQQQSDIKVKLLMLIQQRLDIAVTLLPRMQ